MFHYVLLGLLGLDFLELGLDFLELGFLGYRYVL